MPSEIENWVDEGKRGMENTLRTKPEDVSEQYERQLRHLQPNEAAKRLIQAGRFSRGNCCRLL
jgi:ribose 1,5-bisphosphokinase PhnN